MESLTLAIVTHNRLAVLQRCLAAIAQSVGVDLPLDIVVVDDGSADGTYAWLQQAAAENPLRCWRLEASRGPAVARNLAVRQARSPWCLFLNDDTLLAADALSQFIAYRRQVQDDKAIIIGNIQPWPEEMTAFEHWSSHGGSQFGHALVPPERYQDIGEIHFVTSNLLVARELMLRHPFDERFPHARYEDRELGYRLARREGCRIHYLPTARSWHCHRLLFHRWLLQWDRFTASALLFANLHPEDVSLRTTLSLVRAEEMGDFDRHELEEHVSRLNALHRDYFTQSEAAAQVAVSFRALQEFARLTYLRHHLGLAERRAKQDGCGALAMVGILAAGLEPTV